MTTTARADISLTTPHYATGVQAATGVALNVTGVDATTGTHVLVWGMQPSKWNFPTASTLNLSAGQTAANAATVAFDQERDLWFINGGGSVHMVADLVGVFAALDPPCTTDCLYTWGNNQYRKLGTGEAVPTSSTPTRALLSGVRAASGDSRNGYALRTDGTVWAWGDNLFGQLGNGWTSLWNGGRFHVSMIPVPVLGLTEVTAIASSEWRAFALRADGTVWTWGDNSSVPVQVSGLTDAVAIASDPSTAYALRADGTVWAWGSGYLGNDPPTPSPVPVQVSGLTDITAIASNGSGAYALHADGTVSAWGDNRFGQLGNGQPCDPDPTTPCLSVVPVPVSGLTGVVALAGGSNPGYSANGYAVRDDGTVWAWGGNLSGALGNGVMCTPPTPCESRIPVPVSELSAVTQIATFGNGGYALRTDGTVWTWGSNGNNALGNNSVIEYTTVPVPVIGLSGVSAIGNGWYSGNAIVPNT